MVTLEGRVSRLEGRFDSLATKRIWNEWEGNCGLRWGKCVGKSRHFGS